MTSRIPPSLTPSRLPRPRWWRWRRPRSRRVLQRTEGSSTQPSPEHLGPLVLAPFPAARGEGGGRASLQGRLGRRHEACVVQEAERAARGARPLGVLVVWCGLAAREGWAVGLGGRGRGRGAAVMAVRVPVAAVFLI